VNNQIKSRKIKRNKNKAKNQKLKLKKKIKEDRFPFVNAVAQILV
jgi:hypothetical protein